jgi:hypothetical protein
MCSEHLSDYLNDHSCQLSLELRGGIDTAVGHSVQDVIEDDEATCFVKDHGVQGDGVLLLLFVSSFCHVRNLLNKLEEASSCEINEALNICE